MNLLVRVLIERPSMFCIIIIISPDGGAGLVWYNYLSGPTDGLTSNSNSWFSSVAVVNQQLHIRGKWNTDVTLGYQSFPCHHGWVAEGCSVQHCRRFNSLLGQGFCSLLVYLPWLTCILTATRLACTLQWIFRRTKRSNAQMFRNCVLWCA